MTVPLLLGVADGVSQIEDFGIDASVLPNELLRVAASSESMSMSRGATTTLDLLDLGSKAHLEAVYGQFLAENHLPRMDFKSGHQFLVRWSSSRCTS